MTSSLRSLRGLLVPGLVSLALVASACTGSRTGPLPPSGATGEEGTPSPVRKLTSIETLRDAFNQDAGSTRLILLISPT